MTRLAGKLPKPAGPTYQPPDAFIILRKCQQYGISYELMNRLNYRDLQFLICEYDINLIRGHLRSNPGHTEEATDEDIKAFLGI